MKKIILLTFALLLSGGIFAQKTAFVNTETIFRSIPAYASALSELDMMAQQEQAHIDADFVKISEMYERYQVNRHNLSENSRKQVEENIIKMEREASEKQANFFGPEGVLMQKRIEKLKPIQDRVFSAVDQLAKSRQYDLVIDISNNPSIIYYNQANDLTQEVIGLLGINK